MPSDSDQCPPTWDNFTSSTGFSNRNKDRIAREVLAIKSSWGARWRATLHSNGIHIQDKPSFQLAISLAHLATYEPNITKLLSTLPTFRKHQSEQAPVSGKRVDPENGGLFGTLEQRIENTSYRFLESWLDFLKTPKLPPSTTTARSGRAAARAAAKRAAPFSSPNKSRPQRARISTQSVEVRREQEAALPDISEIESQEESPAPDSILEDSAVQLTFDEELPASPLPSVHSPSSESLPLAHRIMSQDVAHLLEDPLWRTITENLYQTRNHEKEHRNKMVEAEKALTKAKEDLNAILADIKCKLSINTEVTVDQLEEAIEKLESDIGAEEALRKFIRDHGAEYRRLAAASTSASNNIDALDPTDAEEAIDELSTKLTAYEAAKTEVEEAETALEDAREAQMQGRRALAAEEKRRKTFQEIVKAMDNELTMRVVEEALAEHGE